MVTVTTTVTLPLILSQKCVKYNLNKSKIAREAIAEYIKKYEKELRAKDKTVPGD